MWDGFYSIPGKRGANGEETIVIFSFTSLPAQVSYPHTAGGISQ